MAFTLRYPRQFRSDLGLLLIIIAHAVITFALNTYINSAMPFDVTPAVLPYWLFAVLITGLLFITTLCIRVVNSRILKNPYGFVSTDYGMGLLVFIGFGYLLGSFIVFKVMMSELLPFTWDLAFADLDKAIHFKDPWVYLTALDPYYRIILRLYSSLWHLIVLAATFLICVTRSKVRFRYLWTALTSWIVGGNITPMIFMAAGPVFVENLTGSTRFTGLTDRLHALSSPDIAGSRLPEIMWTAYETGQPFFGSGISAFPSLHVALSTLFFLAARHYGRWIGGLALAYLGFTLLGSVYLGWHYAIDGYASIAMVVGLWKLFGWLETKQKPPTV